MAAELVVIGTSLGGLNALEILLGGLAPTLQLAVAVVQHRSRGSDDALVQLLRSMCPLPIIEPEDKEPIQRGHVYLAPADYHLLVDGKTFALATSARVCHARPSIDMLFESASVAYRERLIGIILTGSSHDGSDGARRIKERGGKLIVQDPTTAESAIMPLAAIEAVPPDHILKLTEIPPYLNHLPTPR